jgi:glycerol-3-phosphate dehydrogenase
LFSRDIDKIKQNLFDVVVVGGGITGACVAHDASLRGMSVALIEKKDFGWFTSSASSKLLHGGIRYLPFCQFNKVRESARERNIFQRIAPHLTYHLPFVIPVFSDSFMKSGFAMKSAMKLYGVVCAGLEQSADIGKKMPKPYFLDKDQIIQSIPQTSSLNNLTGGQVMHESHMWSSERMTLAFVKSAVANGATAVNYTDVQSLVREGDSITGVKVVDSLSEEEFIVRGRITVNAAGPLVQQLNKQDGSINLEKMTTGFSKGVHLLTRQLVDKYAIALATPKKTGGVVNRGGRHIFILPWRGKSLIGTTDVPFGGAPEDVDVTRRDVVDFLADINETFPSANLSEKDVTFAFSGLYPLTVKDIKPDTYQGTGEYQIIDHGKDDNVEGIVTALGAKYTTARTVAETATDILEKKMSRAHVPCSTTATPLAGGDIRDWELFMRDKIQQFKTKIESETLRGLICLYGTEIDSLLSYYSSDTRAMDMSDKDLLNALVDYSVEHEMACSVGDIVFRRTGIGTTGYPGMGTLKHLAERMAQAFHWSEERICQEIKEVDEKYSFLQE